MLSGIEKKLSDNDINFEIELDKLHDTLSKNKNVYFSKLINQLIIFIEGIESFKGKKYNIAYNKFIMALNMTSVDFVIEKFDSFNYTAMELRILMNIGLTLNKAGNKDLYFNIIKFCYEDREINGEIRDTLYINLSNSLARMNKNKEALEIINKGVEDFENNEKIKDFHNIYYTKGLIEYKLKDKEYINSINKSIFLCNLYKKNVFLEDVIFKSSLVKNSEYKFKKEIF